MLAVFPDPVNELLADESCLKGGEPVRAEEQIALSQVISALSFALDLTEDAVPGHAVRCCLLGMRIGELLGISEAEKSDLYYALMLKDAGCSSNSAHICHILGGDDRKAKRSVKTVDWTRVTASGLKLAWKNALPGESSWRKAMRVAQLGFDRDRNNREVISIRCERGADIVRKIGLGQGCANAVHALDEHWDGSGYPDRLRGESIPLLARILAVAQHLDVFAHEESRERAMETLGARRSTWFDPEVVRVAVLLNRAGMLWKGFGEGTERALALDMEPGTARQIGPRQVDRILEAFADVVDAKSPFTYRHSLGVTAAAVSMGHHLGLNLERRDLVRRAALVHDLGKLSISNAILDKRGPLTDSEWLIVREHPRLSHKILERIPSFAAIATIAGRHHERLDGSGYPYRLTAATLTIEDRIVAIADIFGAMYEDRPYRPGLAPEEILDIMRKDVPHKLDPDCFEALLAVMATEYIRKEA